MIIKGYKYNNESDALNAQSQIDSYYGIPISPTATTRHWVNIEQVDSFYYIIYDNTLEIILGKPEDITLPDID